MWAFWKTLETSHVSHLSQKACFFKSLIATSKHRIIVSTTRIREDEDRKKRCNSYHTSKNFHANIDGRSQKQSSQPFNKLTIKHRWKNHAHSYSKLALCLILPSFNDMSSIYLIHQELEFVYEYTSEAIFNCGSYFNLTIIVRSWTCEWDSCHIQVTRSESFFNSFQHETCTVIQP